MTTEAWVGTALFAYLLAMVGLGVAASRASSRGLEAYFLGGRQLGRVVVALSAVVSGRSAWLLLGFTGMAWQRGLGAVWAVVGYIAVEAVLFATFAVRLRAFTGARDCLTLPDFYAARFGDRRHVLRMVLSVIIGVFMVAYCAAQFVAGGKAFASGLGMAQDHGVLLTAGIVLAYTLLGGFLAVSWTDVLQAGAMILALVVLPVVAVLDAGGPAAMWAALEAADPALVDPVSMGLGASIGLLGIGLGSPGNPHILTRYMAIDDPAQLRASAVVGTVANVLMAGGALVVGLAARVTVPDLDSVPGGDVERIYPLIAERTLHPALFGLVVASVFAAIMSTADSQLLVAASTLVRDVYQQAWLGGAEVSDAVLVRLSRVAVAVLVGVALLLGWVADDLVFWLVLFAWAGLGASIGPTALLALYWRRTTGAGALVGLVVGTVVVIVWRTTPVLKAAMYELVPAFALAALATVAVSLLTPARE